MKKKKSKHRGERRQILKRKAQLLQGEKNQGKIRSLTEPEAQTQGLKGGG